MDELIEVLTQIQDLAGVAIEALTDGAKPLDAKEHQALWGEVTASV